MASATDRISITRGGTVIASASLTWEGRIAGWRGALGWRLRRWAERLDGIRTLSPLLTVAPRGAVPADGLNRLLVHGRLHMRQTLADDLLAEMIERLPDAALGVEVP